MEKTAIENKLDKSKSYKAIVNYINTSTFSQETKNELLKWYDSIGKGRVSIAQLRDKLLDIWNATNHDENKIKESIKEAYLNNWFGFYYTNKNCNNKNNNIETDTKEFIKPIFKPTIVDENNNPIYF